MATYEKTSLFTFVIHRFRDGDTVEGFLRCECCRSVSYDTIRIIKIESWEIASADKAKALETAQYLTNYYRGRSSLLTTKSIRRDKYGRILTDLIIDGTALSLQLVETNFAWWGVGEPEPNNSVIPP